MKSENFMDQSENWTTPKFYRGSSDIVATDPSTGNRGCDCLAGLDCLFNIIRALRMGSCLSSESRSPRPSSPLGIRKRKTPKKRPGPRNSPSDYRKEEQLHRIPGRMFLNGSNDIASLFTQQGKKGTNQDAMIVWEVGLLSALSLSYCFIRMVEVDLRPFLSEY